MSQIKSRLKAAYENVEFHASNTWVHDSNAFQRANQELYVRESKVKDTLADEPTRPRTVQDSIPQSRLAQYSNYEYNESRELCYASSATNISFYYPCICKRSSIKEPWMIPEVEQLFIWFSYAPDFNILELLRLEELGHPEEHDKLKVGRNLECRWHDFHEISPVFYETFERTPGKSRYTSCPPVLAADLSKFIPCQLKIQTFEDMILRMKIKSDNVKYLWSDHSRHVTETIIKETKVNLLKSPLGNYFLLENAGEADTKYEKEELSKKVPTGDDHHLKSTDFGYLQNLADSLRALEVLIFNSTKQVIPILPAISNYEAAEEIPKTEAAPTRRLYSAVLQGLATDKKQPSCTDVLSPTNSVVKEQSSLSISSITPTKTTPSSCFSTENSSITALTPVHKSTPILSKNHASVNSPSQWLTQSSHWGTPSSSTKSYAQVSQEKTKYTPPQANFNSFKPSPCIKTDVPSVSSKITNLASNTTITPTYSDACTVNSVNTTPNISCSPAKTTNVPDYSMSGAYVGNTYGGNNICFNANMYGTNNSHFNNSYHFNTQYPTNFQNSSFAGTTFSNNVYTNNTYQSTQVSSMNSRNVFPQFSRQPYPSNQAHIASPHSMWLVQHNRPSSAVYSVAHFATQPYLLLPPPPAPSPPPPPPVAMPPRQNQRWVPPTHYIRTASTLQSYHIPITPQQTSSPLSPQQWGTQNQSLYRANSTQQIPSSSQHFLENLSGQGIRAKVKPKKSNPNTQMNFLQHKGRSRSPEGGSGANERLDNMEVLSGTYSNVSMSYTKRSSAGSSDAFSLPSLEKPFLIKSAASTSSLDYRKMKVYNNYKEDERTSIEKRASAIVLGSRNVHSNFFSSDSEELHTLLPIAASVSEELERQALEQYQASDENFYQELERQAEEQYNQDHSENRIGPPNENLLFGGQTIGGFLETTKHCWFFSLQYMMI